MTERRECSVCFNEKVVQKRLSCGHRFCPECLESQRNGASSVICSFCRSETKLEPNPGNALLNSVGLHMWDATRSGGLSLQEAMTVYQQTLNMLGKTPTMTHKLHDPNALVRETAVDMLVNADWTDIVREIEPKEEMSSRTTVQISSSSSNETKRNATKQTGTSSLSTKDKKELAVQKVAIFGGEGTTDICRFWSRTSGGENLGLQRLRLHPARMDGTATRLPNGNIFLCGGMDTISERRLNCCTLFHQQSQDFTNVINMPQPRSRHSAVLVQGDVFIIGGKNDDEVLNSVLRWSQWSNEWQEIAKLQPPKRDATVVTYDDEVFLFGGRNQKPVSSCFKYNPHRNNWTSMRLSLREAAFGLRAAVMNGGIYITGGENGNVTFNSVSFLDPRCQEWIRKPDMCKSRSFHGLVEMGGKLWAIGGDCNGGIDSDRYVEFLDPRLNRWEMWSQPLRDPCYRAAVCLL